MTAAQTSTDAPVTKRMHEIRLAWSITGRINIVGIPNQAGLWMPDNPDNRRDLEVIAEAGNYAYGPGTHWIERRQA